MSTHSNYCPISHLIQLDQLDLLISNSEVVGNPNFKFDVQLEFHNFEFRWSASPIRGPVVADWKTLQFGESLLLR